MNEPSTRLTPATALTSLTLAPVRTSTPSRVSSSRVAWEIRSGRAGKIRGAASIRMMRTCFAGSTRSSVKETT